MTFGKLKIKKNNLQITNFGVCLPTKEAEINIRGGHAIADYAVSCRYAHIRCGFPHMRIFFSICRNPHIETYADMRMSFPNRHVNAYTNKSKQKVFIEYLYFKTLIVHCECL